MNEEICRKCSRLWGLVYGEWIPEACIVCLSVEKKAWRAEVDRFIKNLEGNEECHLRVVAKRAA